MLARIQQLIAVTLSFGLLVAVGTGWWANRPWIGFAYVGLVIGGYLAVLAGEFALLLRSYEGADPRRPSVAQLAGAWAAEVTAAPKVFFWRQPFRSRLHPDRLPETANRKRGVVLVHGFFCNRGLWNPWLVRLRAEEIPFVAVDLEPVFGPIDGYRHTIDAAARRLAQVTGLAPVIVAHSMGGLAARAWLADTPDAPWHRLVTIASPHAGTRLGVHGRGENIAQMRFGSEWLARLGARESADRRARFTCFWSHCDNIVFPTLSATLAGADNRHLDETPHVKMVYHPAVLAEVLAIRPARMSLRSAGSVASAPVPSRRRPASADPRLRPATS